MKPAYVAKRMVLKERLVAKGFSKIFGIDYFNIFTADARLTALRNTLEVEVDHQMDVKSMDFKSEFLNGRLRNDIYMNKPEGFVEGSNAELVCKLQKTLFGLNKCPHVWYNTIRAVQL